MLCVCNIDGLLDNTLMDYKIIARNKAPPPQPSENTKKIIFTNAVQLLSYLLLLISRTFVNGRFLKTSYFNLFFRQSEPLISSDIGLSLESDHPSEIKVRDAVRCSLGMFPLYCDDPSSIHD